ncbi:MAG: hypothetical protein JHD03_09470, partial [Solirubrobacteraceae bacterium]|nr:hypothetical protein [Solirubrobacteraceae bacterium]
RAAHERGEQLNLAACLAGFSGDERDELEVRITRYLIEEAPLRSYDAAAFALEQQTPVMQRAAELFDEAAATNLVAALVCGAEVAEHFVRGGHVTLIAPRLPCRTRRGSDA